MNDLLDKAVLFVGGKGGVGKSTSAAAIALNAARKGKRTLLVSTDPAHNIGDVFHMEIGGQQTKITDRLWGMEIDPKRETDQYINTVKENIRKSVKANMLSEVHKQIDTAAAAPGAEEAAIFDKIVSIILEESQRFELIVFDTAPTGHTIRLLTLPELLGVWITGMLERRQKTNRNYSQLLNDGDPVDDPIYRVLQNRKQKFADVRTILLNKDKTGFVFVLNPERLPILETEKALSLLEQYELYVSHLIINKVLPLHADGEFLQKRRELEKDYLELIENTFSQQMLIKVPLFEGDISSLDKLELFSNHLADGLS